MAYDYRSIAQAIGVGGRLQFLPGNSTRVSLFVSLLTAGAFRICYANGAPNTFVYLSQSGVQQVVLTFRDYGTIIQSEVWIENASAAGITVSVTELYRISECL